MNGTWVISISAARQPSAQAVSKKGAGDHHEIARDQRPARRIVEPGIAIGRGIGREVEAERARAERKPGVAAHLDVWQQVLAVGDRIDAEADLGFFGVGDLGIGKPRPGPDERLGEEAVKRADHRQARVELGVRIDRADLLVAAAVIEVPVGVRTYTANMMALKRLFIKKPSIMPLRPMMVIRVGR